MDTYRAVKEITDQWQGLEDLSRGEGEGQMEDWSEEFKENDTDVFSDSDPEEIIEFELF